MRTGFIVATIGVAMVALPVQAAPASVCDARFTPPHAPQRLTRTLIRDLADGKQIIATRMYRIRFLREGKGWRVEGEQIGVEVSAPPPLAALASLERARIDRQTFPMQLDAAGHIMSAAAPASPPPPMASASKTKAVEDLLGKARLTPAQRSTAEAVSHAMLSAGANAATPWPADLFDAAPGSREELLHPTLPDGTQGDVRITTAASHPDCAGEAFPAMRQMQRDVTTRLGGTSRHTREIWTITPEPAPAKDH